jgi:hypothetical protein
VKPHYLYKITNTVNGKMYIGVTKDPEKRKKQHFHSYPTKGKNYPIRHALKKYGRDNFSFEIICIGSEDYIYDLEKKAIIAYGTIRKGYNVAAGGKGGAGSEVKIRADDKPMYVSGFWFPNRRLCMKAFNVSASTLHGWKVSGKLGNERKLKSDSCTDVPVYVGGFWFSDIHKASFVLCINEGTLKSRIRLGMLDQIVQNPGRKKVRVSVEGVEYSSLADAGKFSGYTIKMLRRRIADQYNPNFYIIEEVQNE